MSRSVLLAVVPVITFPSAELAERFAIDNVMYHRGNG
jgi:hypothetical protein